MAKTIILCGGISIGITGQEVLSFPPSIFPLLSVLPLLLLLPLPRAQSTYSLKEAKLVPQDLLLWIEGKGVGGEGPVPWAPMMEKKRQGRGVFISLSGRAHMFSSTLTIKDGKQGFFFFPS